MPAPVAWLYWALLLGVAMAGRGSAGDHFPLARTNAALRAWLQAIEADAPYLLVDRGAAELRLMHGGAILRRMAVVADSLGDRPAPRVALAEHLRRYRPSDPWRGLSSSPFDWEQNLVEDAAAAGALYFTDGVLIYASPAWRRAGAVALRIAAGDLRAMYNTCKPGTALVILPPGWKEGRR